MFGRVAVVQQMGGDHQAARGAAGALQVHLVGVDLRGAREGRARAANAAAARPIRRRPARTASGRRWLAGSIWKARANDALAAIDGRDSPSSSRIGASEAATNAKARLSATIGGIGRDRPCKLQSSAGNSRGESHPGRKANQTGSGPWVRAIRRSRLIHSTDRRQPGAYSESRPPAPSRPTACAAPLAAAGRRSIHPRPPGRSS